jgi:hypothetical protein
MAYKEREGSRRALEEYIPLDMEFVITGGCSDLEIRLVFMKEIVLCKKLRPTRCSDDDLVHDIPP